MILQLVDADDVLLATFFHGRIAELAKRAVEADYKSVFRFPLRLVALGTRMKNKKKKLLQTPPQEEGAWTKAYKEILERARVVDPQAANLAHLCEETGLSPDAALSLDSDTLDKFDLDPADITPGVILRASSICREFSARIQEMVKERNQRYHPKAYNAPEEEKPNRSSRSSGEGKRAKLFGYPVTAVIRWMGKEGDWDFKKASKALHEFGVEVADATIQAQLRAGAKGERGDPAPLREDEANELYEALE